MYFVACIKIAMKFYMIILPYYSVWIYTQNGSNSTTELSCYDWIHVFYRSAQDGYCDIQSLVHKLCCETKATVKIGDGSI